MRPSRVDISAKAAFLILASLCLALVAMLAAGCDDRETKTYPVWQPDLPPAAKAYDTSPESTSELLKDASDALQAKYSSNEGVHFTMETVSSIGSQTGSTRSEGDMAFPDRVKMTTKNFLSADPVSTDVVSVDGKIYTRSPASGSVWQSGGSPEPPPPDPRNLSDFLAYARGSRNFGQESLVGGRKTWHVQVDVDTAMLAASALKRTADPAAQKALEAMKSEVITVDYWIDNEDRVPYQMTVKTSSPAASVTREQSYVFSAWREPVTILKPCENC